MSYIDGVVNSLLLRIDHLVMDMCCFEDFGGYTHLSVDNLLNGSYVKLLEALKLSARRYVLPLNLNKRVSIMSDLLPFNLQHMKL